MLLLLSLGGNWSFAAAAASAAVYVESAAGENQFLSTETLLRYVKGIVHNFFIFGQNSYFE